METKILIGFRPKSNSSCTAKKVTVQSVLDVPFEGEILENFTKDSWKVVDANTLENMANAIADVIREELNNDPNVPVELKGQPNDTVWNAAIDYIWAMRNIEILRAHVSKVTNHAVIYEALNTAKNMYNTNNSIEIVVREHCDDAYNE